MMETRDGTEELPLSHYLMVLWRRKLTIVASMAALALVGWLLGLGLTTGYSSTAQVLAKPVATLVTSVNSNTARDTPILGDDVAIMSSDSVLAAAEEQAGHGIAVKFSALGAELGTESNAVNITVTGKAAYVQADAQAIAETYVSVRRADVSRGATTATAELTKRVDAVDVELAELNTAIAELDAQIAAESDEAALRGLQSQRADLLTQRGSLDDRRSASQQQLDELALTSAVNPTLGVDLLAEATTAAPLGGATQVQYSTAGLALGLILGVLLAFAREYFDRSVRTTRDVMPGVRVLGAVP